VKLTAPLPRIARVWLLSTEELTLEGPDYYYYLSVSECYKVDGISDVDDFKEMMDALNTLGFTDNERRELLKVTAIVLWIGNIAFSEDNQEKAYVQDKAVVDIAAGLLGVQAAILEKALTTRKIQTGSGAKAEVFTKPNTAADADYTRDTLAKAIYSKMFDFLVARINASIRKDNFKGIEIGVLDIYGFEIFQHNSFEQLCINFGTVRAV
jgi:myosin I